MNSPDYQQGFSLIELMIALLITAVLALGLVQIHTAGNQTFRMQDSLSRIQENGRLAIAELRREISMAGFTGCSRNIQNWAQGTEPTYLHDANLPLIGWEADQTAPGQTYTINTAPVAGQDWSNGTGDPPPQGLTIVPGSDVLLVNRAIPANADLQGNPADYANTLQTSDDTKINQGTLITAITSSCSGGDMFLKDNPADSRSIIKSPGANTEAFRPDQEGFSHAYDDNASVYVWQSTAYYIRLNANSQSPSLYRSRPGPGATITEELVEGVENMQVLYGRDVTGNGSVDDYVTAADVADWSRVVSARVSLLLRSMDEVRTEVDERIYNLAGTRIDTTEDRHLRQVVTMTVSLRNRF